MAKIQIKIETKGLSWEENEELHNLLRKMNRRRKHRGEERICYELQTQHRKYVTRN